MFCENCGTKNEDDAKFCTKCGKSMGEPDGNSGVNNVVSQQGVSNPETNGNVAVAAPQAAASQLANKAKALPKTVFIGIGAAIVALIVVICVVANLKTTIKLDDYLTIEANGYDGYGTASVIIDWDGIEEKYGDKLSLTSQAILEFGGITPMDILRLSIHVSLDETNKLSNGDIIAYTWNVDEELFTYVECKTKYTDDSYTVEGLTEIGSFDAFADLEVTFSGISPNGRLDFNYTGSQLSYYDFNYDKYSGLRNGDVVTFTVTNTNMEYFAERFGMIPDSLEKEYVVSGLDEYVESYASLSGDFIAELQSETEDTIYAYAASSYNTTSSLTDLAYAGYILSSAKENGYNELYIIYCGTVSSSNGSFSTSKVYFPVKFRNILSGENGLSYEAKDGIVGNSNLDGSYSTRGYRNPLTCYMEIVEAKRDTYTSECGDGFEIYAEYDFITSLDDISDEYKELLYADARDRIESYIASSYNVRGTEVSFLGAFGEYLLLAKTQGSDFANNNIYYVVFAAAVSNSEGRFETTTVYYPVEYDGIVRLPGDEYMTTTTRGLVSNSVNFPNSSVYTRGFIDGFEMYSKLITAKRENYTYEVSESLKQFGE